jgi:hypothetical protein
VDLDQTGCGPVMTSHGWPDLVKKNCYLWLTLSINFVLHHVGWVIGSWKFVLAEQTTIFSFSANHLMMAGCIFVVKEKLYTHCSFQSALLYTCILLFLHFLCLIVGQLFSSTCSGPTHRCYGTGLLCCPRQQDFTYCQSYGKYRVRHIYLCAIPLSSSSSSTSTQFQISFCKYWNMEYGNHQNATSCDPAMFLS